MTHVPCTPAAEIPETLAPTGALGLTSAQLQARLDEIHPVGSIDRTETEWFRTAVFYEVLVRSFKDSNGDGIGDFKGCLLYTSPSPRDLSTSRMPSSA